MQIRQEGQGYEMPTFKEFMDAYDLTLVFNCWFKEYGVGIPCYRASIENGLGLNFFISDSKGDRIRSLYGDGPTEWRATWNLMLQMVDESIAESQYPRRCINVPFLRSE